MKNRLFLGVTLFFALGAAAAFSAQDAKGVQVRGKHASEGVGCADCHKVERPVAAASEEACLECHGSYQKVAQLTKALHANPHDSHLGMMGCLKCHRVHRPSEIVCIECHSDFEFREM